MTISKMKMKFLGKVGYVFRVFSAEGELIGCYGSQEEAEEFVNAK